MKKLFDTLNKSDIKYVVLRNWEYLPEYAHPLHDDIDLLVDDLSKTVKLLDAKKTYKDDFRVQYKIKGHLFDIRYVGDGYFPNLFQTEILNNRKFYNGFYVPNDEHQAWSLLYHAFFHKRELKKDYISKIKNLISRHSFGISKPDDLSVLFNDSDLIFNENVYRVGTTSMIFLINDFVVKKYFKNYSHCYKNEVDAFKKLNNFKYFPKLISNDNLSIVMNYCGELLCPDTLPKNWREQYKEIIQILKDVDIVHRDITPFNICVKDGLLKIIDFGWATTFDKKENLADMSESEKMNLGLSWKSDEFDDSYSLLMVLSEFFMKKTNKIPPSATFAKLNNV